MSNEYILTLVLCSLLYISYWLSVDHRSMKFPGRTYHTKFISIRLEKIIFPFKWYENRPTHEYVLGLTLLSAIISIISFKLLISFFNIPETAFEFVHTLSKCVVIGVILAICIYYCFTVKNHPVKKAIYYLVGAIFIILLIITLAYPFIS